MRRLVEIALAALALDLGAIVVTGGVSFLGPTEPSRILLRVAAAMALVFFRYRLSGENRDGSAAGYAVLLLLLLVPLHFQGYRLRGDGLWYYAYARSLAIDGDLDLENEYQGLGIAHFVGSQTVPATGRARNTFPVGVGFLWTPFVEAGHAGVALRNAFGDDLPYDGFVLPYQNAVALGNLLLGWVGLLVLDRLLRQWFSPAISFWAGTATVVASFLLWYLAYQPILTHAASFLLTSLLLLLWTSGRTDVRWFALMGLVVGLSYLVRWQCALLGLLPAWTLFRARLGVARGLTSAAALGGTFFLAATPQLVSWKIIFGQWVLGVPLGADYMRWADPFVTETLFSSRHGLFSWSPILLLGAFGLVGFTVSRPGVGVPLLGMLGLFTYVNSSVADWWAGGTFGARRFDAALPLFALGLAWSFRGMRDLVSRKPGVAVFALVFSLSFGNLLFMQQYRKGRIPVDDTISYYAAGTGMLDDFLDTFGYPFSFPENWAFALRYGRPKTQYDLLVGKYLFHRQNNLGGVIDLGPNDPPFVGNGWSGLRDFGETKREVRFAVGERAGLFVPTDRAETLEMTVVAATPPGVEPAWVEVFVNGERLDGFRPGVELSRWTKRVDRRFFRRINLVELVRGGEGNSPEQAFLVVDRIEFRRVS